jgi:hypothetical protein
MSEVLTASLLEHFSSLEDPRVERTKLHLLSNILALTSFLCGRIGTVGAGVKSEIIKRYIQEQGNEEEKARAQQIRLFPL